MSEQAGLWIVERLVPDMQNVVLALVYGIQRNQWVTKVAALNKEYKEIWNGEHCYYLPDGSCETYPAQWAGSGNDVADFHGREANHRFWPIYWPSEEDEKTNGPNLLSSCNIWNFKTKRWVGRVPKNY